jgi:quinoprotein dehydrogenase-associated probable ABC transporter substrate-binding protein
MSSACKMLAGFLLCSGVWLRAAVPPLRVCADPNDMPFSNQQEQGFENKLAEILAKDLGTRVAYTWFPQGEKFFGHTLVAGVCDIVLSVPQGFPQANTTHPYYRSTYVFLSRRDRHLHIHSFDDPRLRHLRIAVHVLNEGDSSLPPVHALIKRGIVRNLVGYSIFGNPEELNPQAEIVEAVARKAVDVAVVWGPIAGYYARRSPTPLDLTPIASDAENPALPLTFNMAIGTRPNDVALRKRLDSELKRREPEIRRLLSSYGIPQLDVPSPVIQDQ